MGRTRTRRPPAEGVPGLSVGRRRDRDRPAPPRHHLRRQPTGGILKSSDGGTTWAVANTGLTDKRIYTLLIDPRNPRALFTGTWGGVFRSTDGAQRWQPYDRGLPAGGVAAFAIDPSDHTVFAGTNGDGVVSLRLSG